MSVSYATPTAKMCQLNAAMPRVFTRPAAGNSAGCGMAGHSKVLEPAPQQFLASGREVRRDHLCRHVAPAQENGEREGAGALSHITGPAGIIRRLKLKHTEPRDDAAEVRGQFMRALATGHVVFQAAQPGVHELMGQHVDELQRAVHVVRVVADDRAVAGCLMGGGLWEG